MDTERLYFIQCLQTHFIAKPFLTSCYACSHHPSLNISSDTVSNQEQSERNNYASWVWLYLNSCTWDGTLGFSFSCRFFTGHHLIY